MEIAAFIIGLLAVACFLLSYQMKRRKGIILLNATSRALYILQYILLGAFDGAALDVSGIVASILAGKKDTPLIKKHLKLFVVGIDLIIIASGLIFYRNIFSLFPIVGVLLHTSAFWLEREKHIRLVSLLGSPFWLVFNITSGAYGSAIGDTLSIVSILIAIFRYDILNKHKGETDNE
ncbi:MAG: YgjV family protein [Clostridia bacterium]|nr:YgjV family protein [Clostridia bacterium]